VTRMLYFFSTRWKDWLIRSRSAHQISQGQFNPSTSNPGCMLWSYSYLQVHHRSFFRGSSSEKHRSRPYNWPRQAYVSKSLLLRSWRSLEGKG
jgi:hypothetical protein